MGVGDQCNTPVALCPENTQYLLYKRLCGSQGWSEWVRKILPPPRYDPWNVHSVVSLYTDYVIQAHSKKDMHEPNLITLEVLPFCVCTYTHTHTYSSGPATAWSTSSSLMAVRLAVIFCWISWTDKKQWSLSPIWSLGKSHKLHSKRSGEYSGWEKLGSALAALQAWCDKADWHGAGPNSFSTFPPTTYPKCFRISTYERSRIYCLSYMDELMVHHTQVVIKKTSSTNFCWYFMTYSLFFWGDIMVCQLDWCFDSESQARTQDLSTVMYLIGCLLRT